MALRSARSGLRRRIENNGVGLAAERPEDSLGLRLIETFARQIKGRVVMEARAHGEGTVVAISFPDPSAAPG